MDTPFEHITVSFPNGYTEEDAARLRAEFPGVHTILNTRSFAIEEEGEGDAPSQQLKAVFAWVEKHL
jgi:hypothetical protein